MNIRFFYPILVTPIFLTGCMTYVEPEKLAAVTRNECVIVAERISYKDIRGYAKAKWEVWLSPGVYRAEKEDTAGVYFRGNGRPITQSVDVVPGKYFHNLGGIWVAKAESQNPRLYTYVEQDENISTTIDAVTAQSTSNAINQGFGGGTAIIGSTIGGAIATALVLRDVGKIKDLPEISDEKFASIVKVVQKCP